MYTENDYPDPDLQGLVFDLGTGMMKCGFSGDDAPRAVFPTILGYPKNPGIMVGMDAKDCFVGDEAQAKRGILNLRNPWDGDHINWNDYEKMYHHSYYNELSVTPEEHPVFQTSIRETTKERKNLVKATQIQFETFNTPAFLSFDATVTSLYASGRETGTVLDIGDGIITCQSIFDGLPIEYSKNELDDQTNEEPRKRISGNFITDILTQSIDPERNFFSSPITFQSPEIEIIRDIKEKLCDVNNENKNGRILSLSPEEFLKNGIGEKRSKDRSSKFKKLKYELPDGRKMEIGEERFLAPEILFQPNLVGYCLPGVHKLVQQSIERCHPDLRHTLYSNIVVSGGTTLFDHFPTRLKLEIEKVLENSSRKYFVKINDPAERKFSAWIGGSILTTLSTFSKYWITKFEYDEYGPTISQRKCTGSTGRNDQFFLPEMKKDIDEDERREYALFECYVGVRGEDGDDSSQEDSFSIKCSFSSISVRFKTFLLL